MSAYVITFMSMCVQMPVQSECYRKVKAVCDRLAVLAAQCSDEEFEKRFQFLDAVCKSWAWPNYQQKDVCHVNNAEVTEENLLSELSEVETVTYSEDSAGPADVETLLTRDDGSSQRGCDRIPVQSQLGMSEYCVWNVLHCGVYVCVRYFYSHCLLKRL